MDDYSKKIHNVSNEIAKDLLVMLAENKDTIVIANLEPTEDEAKKINEDTTDFATLVVEYVATKDIPAGYASMAVQKLEDALQRLRIHIDGTVNTYKDEYLSRSLGVKNEDGKFRQEAATIGQLLVKLNDVREETGGNLEDFYNNLPENLQKNV
jgi:hypothetical protein